MPGNTPRTLHTAVVAEEIDLHGLTVDQAERRAEGFLKGASVRLPGQVVRIITGKGTRSPGAPAIQPTIREGFATWLAEYVADWSVDVGGGAFLVRLKGGVRSS